MFCEATGCRGWLDGGEQQRQLLSGHGAMKAAVRMTNGHIKGVFGALGLPGVAGGPGSGQTFMFYSGT